VVLGSGVAKVQQIYAESAGIKTTKSDLVNA